MAVKGGDMESSLYSGRPAVAARGLRWAAVLALSILSAGLALGAVLRQPLAGGASVLPAAAVYIWFARRPMSCGAPAGSALVRVAAGALAVAAGVLLVTLCGFPVVEWVRRAPLLALLGLAGGSVACVAEPWVARVIARIPGGRVAVALALGLALGVFLTGQNIHARWWSIDDHDLPVYTGEDGKLGFREIPATLRDKTEVGSIGQVPRCRPVYLVVRMVECALWGMRPGLWYASHSVMLGLSIGLFLLLVRRWMGWAGALAFTLFVLLPKYWVDVWTRLGPSEPYAAVGLALYALGLFGARERPGNPLSPGWRWTSADWLLMLVGAATTIGAKENLLILAAPVVLALARCVWSRPRDRIGIVCSLAILAWVAFITGMLALGLRYAGHMYRQSVPFMERVALGFGFLGDARFIAAALVAVAALGVSLAGRSGWSVVRRARWRSAAGALAFSLAAWAVWYASQAFFYGPLFFLTEPQGMRYQFPGLLAIPMALLSVVWFGQRALETAGFPRALRRGLGRGLIIGLVVVSASASFGPLRYYSRVNVIRTREYSAELDRITEACRREPARPVVFASHSYYDLELVLCTARFLRGFGVHNPLYLRLVSSGEPHEDMWREAKVELERQSRAGDEYFRPLAEYDGREAFVVDFSPPPGAPGQALARIIHRYDVE